MTYIDQSNLHISSVPENKARCSNYDEKRDKLVSQNFTEFNSILFQFLLIKKRFFGFETSLI